MNWKEVFAEMVYIAVDKDYIPDGLWDHWDEFKEAYREFFGKEFGR